MIFEVEMGKTRKVINQKEVKHVFIIGAKSIGQYGGYETFVDRLTEQHQNDPSMR